MIGLRLLAVLMLVGINGFFATAEFSLVAVRSSRVRQLLERGDPRARIVHQLVSQLDRVFPSAGWHHAHEPGHRRAG